VHPKNLKPPEKGRTGKLFDRVPSSSPARHGLVTVVRLRRHVLRAVAAKPDGLLLHESFYLSLFPLHVGLRQYWPDFDALERWARTSPHREWWKSYIRNPRGTGFWHETYSAGPVSKPFMMRCANRPDSCVSRPARPAAGRFFSARKRLRLTSAPPANHDELSSGGTLA
jgi:hypothetical protein